MFDLQFYQGKKVFITGHTGFKGSWMCQVLAGAGAIVTGYALKPPTEPALFELCKLNEKVRSVRGDVRDFAHLKQVFDEVQPEIVIHMAAQPIVRESYVNPLYTYETNVMGTANILECVRLSDCVRSFLNVTTDKVYHNEERMTGYREEERLGGYDPYSNSKACSELVTASYLDAFLRDQQVAVSTARAGNVIGGGDFARDRILPDCIRAVEAGQEIIVRNPHSIRPYQHVLEPVMAYLMICQRQYEDPTLAGSYNVGPDDIDCLNTGELVTLFCDSYNNYVNQKGTDTNQNPEQYYGQDHFASHGNYRANWTDRSDNGPHEANFLKLDCTKLKHTFGWEPRWHIQQVMEKIVEWEYARMTGADVAAVMEEQIAEYLKA